MITNLLKLAGFPDFERKDIDLPIFPQKVDEALTTLAPKAEEEVKRCFLDVFRRFQCWFETHVVLDPEGDPSEREKVLSFYHHRLNLPVDSLNL